MLINYGEYVNNDLEVAHPQSASSPTIPNRLEFGKNWHTWGKTTLSKQDNQQQTQPT